MDFWVYNNKRLGTISSETVACILAEKYPDAIYFQAELVAPTSRYNRIRELESRGILSQELCPENDYWHWDVVHKDLLPIEFLVDYEIFGEIRYY